MKRFLCLLLTACISMLSLLLLLSCSSPTNPDRVASPVFTPPGGNYTQAQQVSIACATDGAEIRYTTDGSTPPTNSMVYTAPFMVELGTTVKAIATKAGRQDSRVVQAFYSGVVPVPSFGDEPYVYYPGNPVRVFINGSSDSAAWPDGVTVRYTLDGTNPDSTSALCDGEINLTQSCTIKARAFRYNWTPSSVVSAAVTIINQLDIIGSCHTPGNANGVTVSGSYAYVADEFSGLQIVNVSNPDSPSLAGACDTPDMSMDVAVSGNYAYVADYYSGLQIVNISNPDSPSIAGACNTPGFATGVTVSGSYAYVADEGAGLQIINISNPASPSIAGTCDISGNAMNVAVSGSYAYVAEEHGLQIVNISNPASPSLAGTCFTPGLAYAVAVSGSYAYLADNTYGLQIVNISNPASPFMAGTVDTPGYARCVAVSGSYAYVADDVYGLQIINVSNPASPQLVSYCDTPGSAQGVAVSGDYAYVADGSSGLQIIELEQ